MPVFYFAWVDPGTPFNSVTHAVNDETVLSFDVEQKEGDFATLRITIVNPFVGLLSPGRKQWAWVSWDNPYDPSAEVEALGLFRLNSIPEDIQDKRLSLDLYARPMGVDALKAAVADTMRDELFDPVFIDEDERENPDSVLEARTELFDFDRVDHVVRTTDFVSGEDGTLEVGIDTEVPVVGLGISYGDYPAESITVNAEVHWDQKGQGEVDLSDRLVIASNGAGGNEQGLIATYTGQGLGDDWPEKGISIGGDWSVGDSEIEPAGIHVQRVDTETTVQGMNVPTTEAEAAQMQAVVVGFKQWRFKPTFKVIYDTTRQYTEKLTFTLNAGVQAVATEPGDGTHLELSVASRDVAALIDEVDTHLEMPIGDIRRRAYFTTDRGKQSVEWLIGVARSTLIKHARMVEIALDIPFQDAVGLNCRQNVHVVDSRVPGGEGVGKVIEYGFGLREGGKWYGRVVVGCLVGAGDAISASPGDPVYVEEGYVESGYQQYEGQTNPVASSVTYGDYYVPPNDDGVNLFQMTPTTVVQSLQYLNGVTVQRNVIQGRYRTPQEVADALNAVFTEIRIVLVPLNTGPFETSYTVPVSDLVIARNVDLEAT